MRTYGKVNGVWTQVNTDSAGNNDAVYLTTLIQCLKMSIGESPFWANYGIPAQQSVVTQVFPDYYVAQTQSQFAPFFASLQITKQTGKSIPTYLVNVVTKQGVQLGATVPV